MTTEDQAYTSKDGGLWVFPEGPNHAPGYIGCTDADDISEPKGDAELIRCFGPDGKYQVVGTKSTPPDPVTTTLTSLTFRTRSLLERIRCEYGLMFLQRDGGRADLFCNHQRALILTDVRNTEKTYGNVLKREEDVESTRGFSVSATPPVIDVVEVAGKRITTTEINDFHDVAMLKDECTLLPLKDGIAVSDGSGVYAPSQVWLTHDGGQTWTLTATSPFGGVEDLYSCAILDMCHGVRRLIVAKLGDGTAMQGQTAYSDDDGASWTEVDLGGATDGHGPTHGGGIFALDERHIWLASAAGYIYFSDDGSETSTAIESGALHTDDYTQIEFTADGLHGYAGAEDGQISKTTDGGTTWALDTILTGANDVLSVSVLDDDYVWVGTNAGELFWTEDSGATWTQRTGWVGSGVGEIHDIGFADDYVGFMIVDNATPLGKVYRTIDGGYSWEVITAPTNSGLTALAVGDENYAVYVGLEDSGTGFLGVIEE